MAFAAAAYHSRLFLRFFIRGFTSCHQEFVIVLGNSLFTFEVWIDMKNPCMLYLSTIFSRQNFTSTVTSNFHSNILEQKDFSLNGRKCFLWKEKSHFQNSILLQSNLWNSKKCDKLFLLQIPTHYETFFVCAINSS
jgi:hypothetical protein